MTMNLADTDVRDLALQLVSDETDNGKVSCFTPAARVCEKLGAVLSKLAGPAGAHSLLARALALAQKEEPSLVAVKVMPDGTLQGFEEMNTETQQDELKRGGIVLVAQLLGLLHAFIGQRLTRQMVDEAWPATPPTRPAIRNTEQ